MNEKLNTYRALKDLEPAETSFFCRFSWHTWTKWSDIQTSPSSMWARQNRFCVHCNAFDQKKWQVS